MHRISRKLLLTFSISMLSIGGIVWACGGGDYDENDYSSFSPEAFVDHQYSPFFYSSYSTYYGYIMDDSNVRYNESIVEEWNTYFDQKLDKTDLKILLLNTTLKGIDSVSKFASGQQNALPPNLTALKLSKIGKSRMEGFLAYLLLAKECESFAVNDVRYSWDEKVAVVPPAVELNAKLLNAFKECKDIFIKERLWFQLVRYNYFLELQPVAKEGGKSEVVALFEKYESSFPKNMVYYRAMGYVAGHYYKQKEYARANYLYSLCFNFSSEMKVPSKWSFHPQEESDWEKSLQMAKNKEEKITLWQMLGIYSDEDRAIENIYALDPQSDKLEVLLSRLINLSEIPTYSNSTDSTAMSQKKLLIHDQELVSGIARKNDTAKPYYWNLAAGYLYSLSGDYAHAKSFYHAAKSQLPKNDKLVIAQHKLLEWTVYLAQLKKIDAKTESEMVEPLTWLANLRDGKDTVSNLRFNMAVGQSIKTLASLYIKQGDLIKTTCFESHISFYTSNANIEGMKALLGKVNKTPFEIAMLRYYRVTLDDLNYHQGTMLVYQEKTDQAIAYFEKSGKRAQFQLLGNPFSIRINDCHDCDFEAVQKVKFTPLSFLKAIKGLKSDIVAGKNSYVNAFLLADAYYNITHYGNARTFYASNITQTDGGVSPLDIPTEFRVPFTSAKLAEKYYLLARTFAKTKEQKSRCTFMAAKCERNELYNAIYNDKANENKYSWDFNVKDIPSGQYFAALKRDYSLTQYYKEILKECGYFRTYTSKH